MLNCGFYLTAKNFGYPCPESRLELHRKYLGIFKEKKKKCKRHPKNCTDLKNAVLDHWNMMLFIKFLP